MTGLKGKGPKATLTVRQREEKRNDLKRFLSLKRWADSD